jgi:uncharacterized protein (DUF3820 family)
MNDNDKMPFGKYKGEMMANIPAEYLIWLYENGKCYGDVKKYLDENIDTLVAEVAMDKKMRKS